MAGKKQVLVNKNRLLFGIVCLTIVYQLVSQVYMWHAFGDDTSDHECELGLPLNSPQCLELEIFQRWKLEVGAITNLDEMPALSSDSMQLSGPFVPSSQANDRSISTNGSDMILSTSTERYNYNEIHRRWGEFDKLYNETLATLKNHSTVTPSMKSVEAIQKDLQARLEIASNNRRSKKESSTNHNYDEIRQRWNEFDKLYNETLATLKNHSAVTPFMESLEAIQKDFQAQLDSSWLRRRQRAASFRSNNFTTKAVTADRNVVAKKGAEDLNAHSVSSAAHAHGTHGTAFYEEHSQWEKSFNKNVTDLLRILCAEPERHDYPACAQFFGGKNGTNGTAIYEQQVSKLQSEHSQWAKSFNKNATDILRVWCAESGRHDYPTCAQFFGDNTGSGGIAINDVNPRPVSLRGAAGDYSKRLKWPTAVAWGDKKKRRQGSVVASREELVGQRWQGRIPDVACITAVSAEKDVHAKLERFLSNFKGQSYEGSSQLVLVYRSIDTDLGDLLNQYADGNYIIAAAIGDPGPFPSTSALRFGSWSTKADVIVRWDFTDWYHPDRLSMQVRALALTDRPVSLLKPGASGKGETVPGWERSIAGERTWMHKHWMPLLAAEHGILETVQIQYVAQVDMPELVIYGSDEPSI